MPIATPKSTIPVDLARELNWHKRQCMGARGTTSFTRVKYDVKISKCVDEEINALYLRQRKIDKLLQEQITAVEELFLKHGSSITKATILTRRKLNERMRRGDYEMTDEELKVLAGKRVRREL